MSVESNNKAKRDLKGTGSLNRHNAPLQLTVKQRRAARAASLRLRGFPARVLLSPCERPAAGAVPRALRADGRLLPAGKGPLCACREAKTQRRSKTYKDRETPEGGARAPRGVGAARAPPPAGPRAQRGRDVPEGPPEPGRGTWGARTGRPGAAGAQAEGAQPPGGCGGASAAGPFPSSPSPAGGGRPARKGAGLRLRVRARGALFLFKPRAQQLPRSCLAAALVGAAGRAGRGAAWGAWARGKAAPGAGRSAAPRNQGPSVWRGAGRSHKPPPRGGKSRPRPSAAPASPPHALHPPSRGAAAEAGSGLKAREQQCPGAGAPPAAPGACAASPARVRRTHWAVLEDLRPDSGASWTPRAGAVASGHTPTASLTPGQPLLRRETRSLAWDSP